jgi:hypothetical protein
MAEKVEVIDELFYNNIFEKAYFTNGDMVLRFNTIKDKESFQELMDCYTKSLLK